MCSQVRTRTRTRTRTRRRTRRTRTRTRRRRCTRRNRRNRTRSSRRLHGLPPPAEWLWPREGDWIQVEVAIKKESPPTWVAAQVVVILVGGTFQAQIVLPDGTDEWLDWFPWEEEGSDWRRAPAAQGEAHSATGVPKVRLTLLYPLGVG